MLRYIVLAGLAAASAIGATPASAAAPTCPSEYRQGSRPDDRALVVACLLERLFSQGSASLGEFDRLFAASWRDARGTIFDFYTSPTGAVLYGQIDAVSRVTGQRVSMRILERYVFAEDGRVSLVQPFYFDTAALPRPSASSTIPQRDPR